MLFLFGIQCYRQQSLKREALKLRYMLNKSLAIIKSHNPDFEGLSNAKTMTMIQSEDDAAESTAPAFGGR